MNGHRDMGSHIDQYQSLNETSKFRAEVDIEEVATKVINMNYGVHRLLSAIVRQRLAERSDDRLAIGILALLEDDLY